MIDLQVALTGIVLVGFLLSLVLYYAFVYYESFLEDCDNKKEFLLTIFVPYYWWYRTAKEGIIDLLNDYKELDK